MHVAFVIHDLGRGGAERSVLQLASGLRGRGHRVDLVLLWGKIGYSEEVPDETGLFILQKTSDRHTEDDAADALRRVVELRGSPQVLDWFRLANALNWDPLCLPHRGLVRRARTIASYMEREKPDCVLPSLPHAIAVTLLSSRLLKEPPTIIPTLHNVSKGNQPLDDRRYRHLFPYASHFVTVSRGITDDLAVTVGAPRDKITTIYNPAVTPDLHAKAAEQPDHPWLFDRSTPVVLAAGRLTEQKDYPTLIKAFGRLVTRRPCRLIILGEGPLQQELESLAGDLDLIDRISFAGWSDNPFAFMSRASVFVLSSRWEGLPTVMVEALACGCPCVSTDCPAGPAEILLNGDIGPLVPVGDDAALAEAVDRVLERPPDRQALQRRAAYFSADRAVAAYEELIASVVRRSGRTSCVSS